MKSARNKRWQCVTAFIGLVIALTLVLVACGSSQTQSSTPTPASVPAGTLLSTYPGHTNLVNSVAWSPDGTRLASGDDDSIVRVWQAPLT
jgi:WD40 repeat protein